MNNNLNKLIDIFNDDPLGLLDVKPSTTPRSEEDRLVSSFLEINDFFEKNNREPEQGNGIQEHLLFSRLKSIRESNIKIDILKSFDKYGLLEFVPEIIESIDDILNGDLLGLLNDDSEGLFDLKYVQPYDKERAAAEFIARRKPCKDFEKYVSLFKMVQNDLKNSKRTLVEFKQGNLRENTFYVHNGVLFYLEKINITQKEHYKTDGTRVREDGRTRCIFENGTESNMLKRSIEKILYANGKVVTENLEGIDEEFLKHFKIINEEDKETGFIYILKSKSPKKEIQEINNLYKIGYSSTTVEERIKNAPQEPTYLMAEVRIVMTYKCFNMNPKKLEDLLHNFFGSSCLNIDVIDNSGKRCSPREWFIAPLDIIDDAINLILNGEIVNYKFDALQNRIIKV